MRNILLTITIAAVLVACGGSDKKSGPETQPDETKKETGSDLSANPDYQKGLELVSQSDCLTCHKVDEVLTGPSYRSVAEKYASMPDTIVRHLAGKVISGGKGVWGEVFMTPHAGLSQEDAEAMVKYILLLKK
jgi:cytochrome c